MNISASNGTTSTATSRICSDTSAGNGWWYFYLVALAVKTPLPLLLLGLTGLGHAERARLREANVYRWPRLRASRSILLFCCLYSHINIGVRHVLIAYPLLAMGAGLCAPIAVAALAEAIGACRDAALLCWQVAILAYAYPDYLAYFNPLAGEHPERILVDSDLDWGGQDLRRLERVLAARQVSELWIGYKGTADLSLEPYRRISRSKPNQPVHGWVAITMLTLLEDPAGYDWLRQYRPVQRVGQSFELYFIP